MIVFAHILPTMPIGYSTLAMIILPMHLVPHNVKPFTLKGKKKKKKKLFKMNRFLFRGTLTRFLFNLTRFLFKNCKLNEGSKINKSLILIINIIKRNKKPTSIYLTNIKLLFDLWPLIQFAIFEEKPFKIEEKSCKCPSEEESIHFEEAFFRVV